MVPHTRSSVPPSGSSTTGTPLRSRASLSPDERLARQSSQSAAESAGSQLYAQPRTDVSGGRRSARARTAVDLPVPRWPMTRTPPTDGETTFSSSASFISSCPTTAVKGKTGRGAEGLDFELFVGRPVMLIGGSPTVREGVNESMKAAGGRMEVILLSLH